MIVNAHGPEKVIVYSQGKLGRRSINVLILEVFENKEHKSKKIGMVI